MQNVDDRLVAKAERVQFRSTCKNWQFFSTVDLWAAWTLKRKQATEALPTDAEAVLALAKSSFITYPL